jgi:diketogulonate reductase-like aldo/keto reductase
MAQPAHPTKAQAISQLRAPLRSSKPGTTIPRLGLGTWQAASEHVEEAVLVALQSGIRHVDTASEYGVEKQVGNAIKRAMETMGLQRDDLHVTTKVRRDLASHVLSLAGSLALSAALECGPLAGGGGLPQVAV